MPTYNATDVTATLRTAPLLDTVCDIVVSRSSADVAIEMNREAKVFEQGSRLQERPIGADGSERGVMQFVGEYQNMPLFMVEAGEILRPGEDRLNRLISPLHRTPGKSTSNSLQKDVDSPLTSLGTTPTFNTPDTPTSQLHGPVQMDSLGQDSPSKAVPRDPQPFPDFAQAQAYRNISLNRHALQIEVQTGLKSHLLPDGAKVSHKQGLGLKIEVFINGHLVDIAFVNPREASVQNGNCISRFTGVRDGRHSEIPLVYLSSDATSPSQLTARQRWAIIGRKLKQEAGLRGVDSRGAMPVSAEYLVAVSNLALPDRLKERAHIGVIDVIITTGVGKKLGPEAKNLVVPERMRSTRFKVKNSREDHDDTPVDHAGNFDDTALSIPRLPAVPVSSSPGLPLAQRTRSFQVVDEDVDLEISPMRAAAQSIARSRVPPMLAPRARSESQPPGQTTPVKPSPNVQPPETTSRTPKALSNLVQAFAEELGIGLQHNFILKDYKTRRGQPGKQRSLYARLSEIHRMVPGPGRDKAVQETVAEYNAKMLELRTSSSPQPPQSKKQRPATPLIESSPEDPTSAFANDHNLREDGMSTNLVDQAIEFGAAPNGRLVQHLAAAGHQSTPTNPNRVSSLANSPGYLPSGEPRAENDNDESSYGIEAICRGSAVAFEDGGHRRQIPKSRPGEYNEEQFVVGMRFVVV